MTYKVSYTSKELAEALGEKPGTLKKRLWKAGIKASLTEDVGNVSKFVWSVDDFERVKKWLIDNPAKIGRPKKGKE